MLVIWNKVQFICFVSIPPLILLVFAVYILNVWNLKHGSMSQKRILRRGPQSLYPHPYPHTELTSHLFNLWFTHFCAFLPQSVFCFLFFPTLKVIYHKYSKYLCTLYFSLNNLSWNAFPISSFHSCRMLQWVNVPYFIQHHSIL